MRTYLAFTCNACSTKAKQVLQKSSRIEIRKFTEETILIHLQEIDEMYNTIVDKANFSFGRLNAF